MSVVARMSTTISPGVAPSATSSETRRASARASASRHGAATPSSSQSAPLSTTTISTSASSDGVPAGIERPGRSAMKLSPSSDANARLSAARISGRERKFVCSVSRAPAAARRSPRARNRSTSAWRNP